MLRKLVSTTAFKHALIFLGVFIVMATGLVGYIYYNTNILLARQFSSTINAEARGLAEQYSAGGLVRLINIIERRSRQPGDNLYLLAGADGRVLAGNLNNAPTEMLSDYQGWIEFAYQRDNGNQLIEHLGRGQLFTLPQQARLFVGRNIEERRKFEVLITSALAWSLGLVLLIGLPVGFFVARRMLKRVDRINESTRLIMQGDLTERIPEQGSQDELDRLARNLNLMLDRIEMLMHGMKEVSDNIAHDLKTPINRLRNRVESALRSNGTKEDYEQTLESTIDECDNLMRIFNALLSIAKVEAKNAPEKRTKIDVSDFLDDIVELYEPIAEEQQVSLTCHSEKDFQLTADKDLLAQAIANMIDNALKYGVAQTGQSKIDITADLKGKSAIISVSDNGAGIPIEDRERVLKRFVRLEQSRTLPGSGLGLSLVNAVVQMHDGELIFEDNAPGLKLSIHLPAETLPLETNAKQD